MKKFLLSLIILIVSVNCWAGDLTVRQSYTVPFAPGCAMVDDSVIYKIDYGYQVRSELGNKFYWDYENYITILFNEREHFDNDFTFGNGYRLRIGYHIINDLNLFVGAGILELYDGQKMDGLANGRWGYGTLEGGIEYKKRLYLGFGHISDPFSHASEGDYGVNTIYLNYKVKF